MILVSLPPIDRELRGGLPVVGKKADIRLSLIFSSPPVPESEVLLRAWLSRKSRVLIARGEAGELHNAAAFQSVLRL